MISIDLNADLGESFGNYLAGNDSEILKYVSSANIACGFHAGDPVVIRNTVKMALARSVSVGAHPGYPDLQGFGRRSMSMSPDEVFDYVLYQVGALKSITEAEGGRLSHVKAHGALYNNAVKDRELADAIVGACEVIDNSLLIFGLPNSELENATLRRGMKFAMEAFADRAYNNDGSLVSRRITGSVITDSALVGKRVEEMVINNHIETIDGGSMIIKPDTICLHGDNRHAIDIAREIHMTLMKAGVRICNP